MLISNCAFFGFGTAISNSNQHIVLENTDILHCKTGIVDAGGVTKMRNSRVLFCENAVVSSEPHEQALRKFLQQQVYLKKMKSRK